MAERREGLLEESHRVAPSAGPEACLSRVAHGLRPHLGVRRMMRERLDEVTAHVAALTLERLENLAVQDAPAIVQQTAVRHVVGQAMAERVDGLGERRLFLEELG